MWKSVDSICRNRSSVAAPPARRTTNESRVSFKWNGVATTSSACAVRPTVASEPPTKVQHERSEQSSERDQQGRIPRRAGSSGGIAVSM